MEIGRKLEGLDALPDLGIDEGMFPGVRDFGERYAGIDQMQEHRANRLKRPAD